MQRFEKMRSFFYEWSRALFISVGHDIYCDGGFRPNFLTFYVYLIILVTITSTIYTFIFYDRFTRLNGIGVLAIALEVINFTQNSCFVDVFFLKLIQFIYELINFAVNHENLFDPLCASDCRSGE